MSVLKNGFATFIHWFAWTLSLGASVFFMFFVIGEGIPDIVAGKGKELLLFLPWLLLAVVGCLVSFFRKKSGALMMLAGGIAMAVNLYLHDGWHQFGMMVVYGGPYILSALLILLMRKR